MRDGFAHWLRTMVQRTGNEDAKAAEEGAAGGANVEPKEAWTPVTNEEAHRVMRALVAGDEAAGGERDDASPAWGTGSKAPHGATPRAAVRKSRALTVIGGVVAVAVVASAARWLLSHRNSAPSAPARASLQDSGTTGGASFAPTGTADGYEQDSGMNRSTTAALVAGVAGLAIAGGAGAQNAAVQWKVSEGGNGHWYRFVNDLNISWTNARHASELVGGHLATTTSKAEFDWLFAQLNPNEDAWIQIGPGAGPYLGGFRTGSDPSAGWSWVTGEPWTYERWVPGEPTGCGCGPGGCTTDERYLHIERTNATAASWNDIDDSGGSAGCGRFVSGYVIEWDADCNGDGIADYGQIIADELADANLNGVPDCCEQGEPCVIGTQAVLWRNENGGNGHWYQLRMAGRGHTWTECRDNAVLAGGHLATVTTAQENQWIASLANRFPDAWVPDGGHGPILGGFQTISNGPPAENWRWVTDEPWNFTEWAAYEPNDFGCSPAGAPESYLAYRNHGSVWNDIENAPDCSFAWLVPSYIVEFDADCNHDNIVDYGQILTGRLADANTNGIPDVCEVPTCRDVDLFRNGVINGADLGILLSEWGPASANTVSDVNHDGQVNGSDLGTLLAFWGPCSP